MQSESDQLFELSSSKDKARLRSIRGIGAGAWVSSIPSSEKFTLSSNNFVLAVSLRIGHLLSLPDSVSNCD